MLIRFKLENNKLKDHLIFLVSSKPNEILKN